MFDASGPAHWPSPASSLCVGPLWQPQSPHAIHAVVNQQFSLRWTNYMKILTYMKYKYYNWGIAWYSPFFRHTQMFVAGCLKGFLWFGKWFVTLSPKLRSSPRWITAFSLGALRFASKHVEIRQRKVPKISDGYWNRFPVPICWRWCQF